MKLVYKKTQIEVKVGDRVRLLRSGPATVTFFRPPHQPSSEGKVSILGDGEKHEEEYYVSVIGAEWIEREDSDLVNEAEGLEFDRSTGKVT